MATPYQGVSGIQFGSWSDFVTGASTTLQNDLSISNLFLNNYMSTGVASFSSFFEYSAQHFSAAAQTLGSFPQSQAALSGLANKLGSLGNGFGWAGAGLSLANSAYDNWQFANAPGNHAQGQAQFQYNMAGHLFGTSGSLLGGVAGEVIGGEIIAGLGLAGGATLAMTIGMPIVIGLAGGAALHGLFNWLLPEHPSTLTGPLSGAGNVGGVLFDKPAVVSEVLPKITGAYWDSAHGTLVLVGPDAALTSLPPLRSSVERDHLIVALRAALANESMGVSIDPPAKYRDRIQSGDLPPDGTDMFVSYLGNTAGTLFGAIMFEADRLMKCLSNGTNNLNREVLLAQVPGYDSLLGLFNRFSSGLSGSWFRFWFVIDTVEIGYNESAHALRFGNVRIKVLNETELPGGKKAPKNKACEAFTDHLTKNYDEYSKEFPVLARLKEIAKIAALARFLVKLGISIDPQTIFAHSIFPVPTPKTTPGIVVAGLGRRIFGGVAMRTDVKLLGRNANLPKLDLAPWNHGKGSLPNDYKEDDEAKRLRQFVETRRPGDFSTIWRGTTPARDERAMAMRLAGSTSPKRAITSSNHAFEPSWRDSARSLRRCYDSSNPGGDFGPGWWLHLPYRLEVIIPSNKRPEVRLSSERGDDTPSCLVVHDFKVYSAQLFRRTKSLDNTDGIAYCLSKPPLLENDQISYGVDHDRVIRFKSGFYLVKDGQDTCYFDAVGRLIEMQTNGRAVIRLAWSASGLASISCGNGRSYEIHYDPQAVIPRIGRIVASDGAVLAYFYDSNGMLKLCRIGGKAKSVYRYDNQLRLSETRNGEGVVVNRSAYDSSGNHISGTTDSSRLSDGTLLVRSFIDGRTHSIKDVSGAVAEFSYHKNGSLASIDARNGPKRMWSLQYDQNGRLSATVTRSGIRTRITYQNEGRLKKVEDSFGRLIEFPEASGTEPQVTGGDAIGVRWSAIFNAQGLPKAINTSTEGTYQLTYDRKGLQSIRSPLWQCKVRRKGDVIKLNSKLANQVKRTLSVDLASGKADVEVKGPNNIRRRLVAEDNGYRIEDVAGKVAYDFQRDSLICQVVIEGPVT